METYRPPIEGVRSIVGICEIVFQVRQDYKLHSRALHWSIAFHNAYSGRPVLLLMIQECITLSPSTSVGLGAYPVHDQPQKPCLQKGGVFEDQVTDPPCF